MKLQFPSLSSLLFLLLSAGVLLTMVGCNHIDPEPVFAVSLHEFVDPGEHVKTLLITEVSTADGSQTRVVRSLPILDWHRFESAELLPDDDGVHAGIKLKIDASGRRLWQQVTGYRSGNKIAVVVDGFYAGESLLPKRIDESGTYETAHIWSVGEAKAIIENVHRNYLIANEPENLKSLVK